MGNNSLKDILLNLNPDTFDEFKNHSINTNDIKDFCELYLEFLSLEKDYNEMVVGRKETSKYLEKKLELLKDMVEFFMTDIKKKKNYYKAASRDLEDSNIDECNIEKVFEVLKTLSSDENVQYETKKINFPAYYNIDHYGYRTTEEYNGVITILGEKNSLSKLDSLKTPLTQDDLIDIYNQGFTMVLQGNDEYLTEKLNISNKQVLGYYKPIVFYLHDDELANSIKLFMDFVKNNGPDLNNIKIVDLTETIKKYDKREKVKEKVNQL